MTMLRLCEIQSGLVAHLDPDSLREYEAAGCTVKGKHDFLIIRVDGDAALVLPLTSKRKRGRCMIPQSAKHGHERWTDPNTYVLGQPFWAPCHAIQEASECELSRVGGRNSVDTSWCEGFM